MEAQADKKKPVIVRILLGIVYFILAVVVAVLLWVGFSTIDRRNPDRALDGGFVLYANVPSVYKTVKPLLDSPSLDSLLQNNGLAEIGSCLDGFRKSSWYKSGLVKSALSRNLSAGVYDGTTAVAAIDMGWLSCATRLLPLAVKFGAFSNVEGVSVSDGIITVKTPYTDLFVKTKSSLVLASTSLDKLKAALALPGLSMKASLMEGVGVNVIADMSKLSSLGALNSLASSYGIDLDSTGSLLSAASGVFSIPVFSDASVSVGLTQVGQKKSAIAQKLAGKAKTCVALNVTDGAQLKNTIIPLAIAAAGAGVDVMETLTRADDFCEKVFDMPLDDLLGSAKIEECAVVQTEGSEAPIFVVKTPEIDKYKALADKALANMSGDDKKLVEDSCSIKDGCIYLSQAPEELAALLGK